MNHKTQIASKSKIDIGLFSNIDKDFQAHLDIEHNHRIFFSGIYGIGKTTFLNYFFKDSPYSAEYIVLNLYPIRYSILSNQDVMTYILYDIVYAILIDQKFALSKEEISDFEESFYWATDNYVNILSTLCLLIPKMGRQLSSFVERFDDLKKSHDDYADEGSNADIMSSVSTFIDSVEKSKKGLSRTDQVTLFIQLALSYLKARDSKKQVVLVIDDLDRVDPHHIFRILNVFSSQFDEESALDNRFGFDKIILVGDINNIRSIYSTKYGIKTDFNGYIDKFYSHDCYDFSNHSNVALFTKNILKVFGLFQNGQSIERDKLYLVCEFMDIIFIELVMSNQLSLRSLLHLKSLDIDTRPNMDSHLAALKNNRLVLTINALASVFGSVMELYNRLSKITSLSSNYESIRSYRTLIGELLMVSKFKEQYGNYRKDRHSPVKDEFSNEIESLVIEFEVHKDRRHFDEIFTGQANNVYRIFGDNSESKHKLEIHNVNWVPLMLNTIQCIYNVELDR